MDARASTAYHEAGHAVVAWLHKISLDERGIMLHLAADGSRAHENLLGVTHLNAPFLDEELGDPSLLACRWGSEAERPAVLKSVEAYCAYSLAGWAAEALATGDHEAEHGAMSDVENAVGFAEALQYALDPPFESAETWLNEVVAPRVDELLRRPAVWAAVERVARALVERGGLTCGEFESLMLEISPERRP